MTLRPEGAIARAASSPLIRGGLTLVIGLLTGNVLGIARVGLMAYLLGTHSRADSLAVAMGPLDTLNSLLINSMVFAFVPMLTACSGSERTALFHRLSRLFQAVFAAITLVLVAGAGWLMRILAPGLNPIYFDTAVANFRILALSIVAAGTAAVHYALLFTERRFAPTAFYQAALNVFTIAGALSLWKIAGVHAFAIGYTAGAWAQLGIVYFASRRGQVPATERCQFRNREILAKPALFVLYAAGLALNITFTRAFATNGGPGMAAALDYCMRGVGVPLALLVTPVSNSLLPEIARLRSGGMLKRAFGLIDRTVLLVTLAAVGGTAFALWFREPAVAIFFQRGSFTLESTRMVSAVFLGLGPCLVGWSLIEVLARALFSLDRQWLPVVAGAIPVVVNVVLSRYAIPLMQPEWIGVPPTLGLLAGFAVLFVGMRARRGLWLREG